jgi:hypothetical protein
MDDNDSKILSKVREQNRSNGNVPEDPYVKIVINKRRRSILSLIGIAVFFTYLFILNRAEIEGAHWLVTVLPIIGLGIIIVIFPPVEQWEYVPWQTAARQYERHQVDRH